MTARKQAIIDYFRSQEPRFTGRVRLLALLMFCVLPAHALNLDVRVSGLSGELEKNVLALLGVYQEREDEALSKLRLLALHRRAPDEIRDALAPFGYYRVQVQEQLTEPTEPDGTWVASYQVAPGDPVKIGQVNYRITGPGADNPAFPATFPMKVGDVLLHADYEAAREEIRSIASRQGYLDAELVHHQVLIDVEADQAIIELQLETGPRYYIGEVTFDQDLLDEDLLRRYVNFQSGAVYDPEILLGLQAKLLGTEYYGKVEIVPKKDQAQDNVIPVVVKAVPNKANKYRFGLGFGTDTGPRAILEWRRRYLTRWGHKLKLELGLSGPIQGLTADYRIPIGDPLRDYIRIQPEFVSFDTATRQGDLASLQVAHSVVTDRGWRRTAGIDYGYEDYTINEADSDVTNELVPNISWAKTVSDDPIYTIDGYRLKYVLKGAVEGLVSDASYLSGSVRFKWIKGFAEDYRFITRTDLGATWADSVLDLPASRRFFAGGDGSVRGWGFDALGPVDRVSDDTVGGRYLAVGSLELERRIKGDWSGAVFTDFGNAFDPDYVNKVAVGAGLGVRWKSPIGQIRFDVAYAINKDDPGARLHFVLGPDL
jgi:translocation and assembly module TamA